MSAALPDDSRVLEEFGVAKKRISEIFNDIDQQMEAVQVVKPYLFLSTFLIISQSSMCSTKLKFRSSLEYLSSQKLNKWIWKVLSVRQVEDKEDSFWQFWAHFEHILIYNLSVINHFIFISRIHLSVS